MVNRWEEGPSMGSKRFALGVASMGGCAYAVGGFDGEAYLSSAERFDPRVGRFAFTTKVIYRRTDLLRSFECTVLANPTAVR